MLKIVERCLCSETVKECTVSSKAIILATFIEDLYVTPAAQILVMQQSGAPFLQAWPQSQFMILILIYLIIIGYLYPANQHRISY